MTSAFETRANRILQDHLPAHADALQRATASAWKSLESTRGYAPLNNFLAELPSQGWTASIDGEAPTFQHTTLHTLPTPATHALQDLQPWRKGPWTFADVTIDAEWRSEQKWQRIQDLLPDLQDKVVFDVGSNNGYYGHRLLDAGARAVLGFDPQPLYVAQALCAEMLAPQRPMVTLPVGLEALVHCPRSAELLLLMGILYHRTDPLQTLRLCAQTLARGGRMLLETIIIPGDTPHALFVPQRYAGAKGFYWLPTEPCLHAWLRRANLRVLAQTDATATTKEEQRSTAWRAGDSLPEGLDPNDPTRTIEGHPAPLRVALVCARG